MTEQVQTQDQTIAITSGDAGKKPRKQRSDKGKPRGPRKPKTQPVG